MKHLMTWMAVCGMTMLINAQTMKLVPLRAGSSNGACTVENTKRNICYGLEYTPAVSGVLTSYTTAFFVSCTSAGPAVAKNQSCSMTNNVSMMNGCEVNGTVLINSSGNSGSAPNNLVTAGVPVILHQICFSIPAGQSVTVKEDPVTDLTTSIDLLNENVQTEYPSFSDMVIRKDLPAISRPFWLDFKGITAGDFTSQLDWSTSVEVNNSHFIVERSGNGIEFEAIGQVEATHSPGRINSYQYLDKSAMLGDNYYRLQQVDFDGNTKYSPVRMITFTEKPFSVKVSPNPADEFILVEIQSPLEESTIRLLDPSGRAVIDEKNNSKLLKTRLNTEKLSPGVYTVIVETDRDKFSEKVVIAH